MNLQKQEYFPPDLLTNIKQRISTCTKKCFIH